MINNKSARAFSRVVFFVLKFSRICVGAHITALRQEKLNWRETEGTKKDASYVCFDARKIARYTCCSRTNKHAIVHTSYSGPIIVNT